MAARQQTVSIQALTPLMEEILASGGSVELTATGNSMCPMLRGHVSRVRLEKLKQLRRGDVLLYRRVDGSYVLHRAVAVEADRCTCCGDAQWALERGILRTQVVAVMTAFTWRGRWVSRDHPAYRIYWSVWTAIRPLRHVVLGGWRRLRRLPRR